MEPLQQQLPRVLRCRKFRIPGTVKGRVTAWGKRGEISRKTRPSSISRPFQENTELNPTHRLGCCKQQAARSISLANCSASRPLELSTIILYHIILEHAVPYWLRPYATSRKLAGSRPDELNTFFANVPNPSGLTALGFTQPLTQMSTRSRKMFLGSRARPGPTADNLTAICESTV
jgi:hypothetical protein